jgi:glycerol kinase
VSAVLVIDVGTSGARTAVVTATGDVRHVHYQRSPPSTPSPGLVEFDALALWDCVHALALATLHDWAQPVLGVGITNQRASTVVWDATTGVPVAPALGWQDLRTLGDCLGLVAEGLPMAPNHSATKLAHLLNLHDGDRACAAAGQLKFGTLDTWLAWKLTNGAAHITEPTNQIGVTALTTSDGQWDQRILDRLNIPAEVLPAMVDTIGAHGLCTALPSNPPLLAMAGDQQASLIGQGCIRPGQAKCTFGTGGMLDVLVETPRDGLGPGRTFAIAARRLDGVTMYAAEAIMLTAGSNVDWLVDDLALLSSPSESADVAGQCDDSAGVVYVPALLGLGAPYWDYGARSGLFGLTRGSERSHIVRAVLEGVAQRAADLVEATELDSGLRLEQLQIDGGMTANAIFVQAVANAIGRPVAVSREREATTLGAGLLAGIGAGMFASVDEAALCAQAERIVEPNGKFDRQRWHDAVKRAGRWHGDLSDFINFL